MAAGMHPDVERELRKRRDPQLRKRLLTWCDGDWARVTYDPHNGVEGSFTVHNRPQVFEVPFTAPEAPAAPRKRTKRVSAKLRVSFKTEEQPPEPCERCSSTDHEEGRCPVPPAVELELVDEPEPPAPLVRKAAPKRKLKSVKLDELAEALGKGRKVEASTTTVVQRTPEERQRDAVAKETPRVWVEPRAGATFDWSTVDLKASAFQVHQRMQSGLPDGIGFFYLPDVLALYGLDTELAESCLRHPERVEVRPETFHVAKGYPVLGFWKGDVNVILGFKEPAKPCVIAVYVNSKLEHDVHRVGHTGGGGARKLNGNPKTVKQLRQHLEARGAELTFNADHTRCTVAYKGEELGQVSMVEHTAKQTVENDWQRTQRRMHAVDQRTAKVGAAG